MEQPNVARVEKYGEVTGTYECHRYYWEGINPFDGDEWKYYAINGGEPRQCQLHGKNSDMSGYCRGISMWNPHCFSKVLIDAERKVLCKVLHSTNSLPEEFEIVLDRSYGATINGIDFTFKHYLLTPSGRQTEQVMQQARESLRTKECSFDAGGEQRDSALSFDFDDCERAVGALRAAQLALKQHGNDFNNAPSDRHDSLMLYAWLGSLEATVDELTELSPWASEVILQRMTKYETSCPPLDSNLLMNYHDAINSLQFQLMKCCCDISEN